MRRDIAGILAAIFVAGAALTGCGQEQDVKAAGNYKMQATSAAGSYTSKAYQDGVMLAHSLGKGLDGRFREQMHRGFAGERLKLTNEQFAEDSRGNTSYQYLINSEPDHNVIVHVFISQSELKNKIQDWYGGSLVETSTTRTEILSKDNTSLVYTSMGKEKGKYSKKVKAMFTGLLEHLNTP